MSAPTTMQWLRTAASRISVGSGRLATHQARRAVDFGRRRYEAIAGWVGKSSGLAWLAKVALLLVLASRIRILLTAIAERVYERVESGAWGGLLFTAAGLWLVGAYRAGRDGWEPKQRPKPTQPVDEEPAGEDEQPPITPPPVSPVALVSAVRDIGTPHAQLKPLAEHLGTTTDEVRAAAQRMAWAVKDVRMQGRSASAGLRWDEAPSPSEAYPHPTVVGTGQAADDDNDDTNAQEPEERFRVVPIGSEGHIVYDAQDTVRHHKVSGQ